MRPLRLELEGFASFRERTEVDFADTDLFVFRGPTGSGKSSLIDAMIFALYGSIPRYDNLNLIAPVVSQGKLRARVRLDFEARGRTYSAVRIVQRTATGATTKEARLEERADDGATKTLAATESELSARVRTDVVGLELDHFTKCVVLPQGEFAAFLRARPAERKRLLERLLGLGLYERLRRAANLRGAEEENLETLLRNELESTLSTATPEAVRGAEARVGALEALNGRAKEVADRRGELDGAIAVAVRRADAGAKRLESLAEVRAPEDVAELAARHGEAERNLRRASEARDAAAADLRAAAAVRAGLPERAAVEGIVKRRAELADLEEEIGRARADLDAEAKVVATNVAQEKAVRKALSEARESLERMPPASELENVREKRGELSEREREIERAGRALAEAERAHAAARERKSEADGAAEVAARALERLRVAHGAIDMAHRLEEGGPCPVCLQNVARLPDHDVPEDLDAARSRRKAAKEEVARADRERDRRKEELTSCETALKLHEESAESLRKALSGTPEDEEISRWTKKIEEREARVELFARRVEIVGRRRTDSEKRLESVSAVLGQRKTFAAKLEAELEGDPAPEETAVLLREIRSAEESVRRARAADDSARRARKRAKRELERGRTRMKDAWSRYRAVRDDVAEMKPPVAEAGDLIGSWTRLSEWAARKRAETRERTARSNAEREAASSERDRLDSRLRERCRREGLSLEDGEDPATRCAEELGAARKSLEHLREAVRRRTRKAEERKRAQARARIARDLGTHLNAKHFGAWLQNRILAWLVQGATARLRELSSGQYSLDLSDRNEFLVVDHRNADERRLAKTLSGGETFLASLALALSLAEQVANLSAQGSARIEALFLDEGFGALDSETLDVVAATIEQLGARRMVGIVTHVSELADRVPVQYRVEKKGNSSSVQRVEA